MMKLATRQEGRMIYMAIECKKAIKSHEDKYYIGRFNGMVEAIAYDLQASTDDVLRMISRIEKRA